MKQQCPVAFIYLSWAIFVSGLIFFLLKGDYLFTLLWLIVIPLTQWTYVRAFPAISRYIGYGSVKDLPAQEVNRVPAKVTLYTALGCPFCPIVKHRLLALKDEMGFDLEEVDITLKPNLLIAKGIRAVPVVEVGKQQLVGHAVSEQLVTFIHNSLSPN